MKWCWEEEPYERPTFLVMTKTIQEMIDVDIADDMPPETKDTVVTTEHEVLG